MVTSMAWRMKFIVVSYSGGYEVHIPLNKTNNLSLRHLAGINLRGLVVGRTFTSRSLRRGRLWVWGCSSPVGK